MRPDRTPALMVLGTASHAGKTAVAAGLCRLLSRRGIRVAPFKAQNMSNNSHVTPEGGEIGRAQALQARAAGVESHTDMNPVLLKPSGNGLCQVILHGRPWANRTARDYYADKAFLAGEARAAYDRLAARFEAVVLEGAGSPAEINLRDEDFVNLAMAGHAGARCLLVADIDRGGVFASILGTARLIEERHRPLLAGVLINKFRGDPSLLDPGIREIEARSGLPVLGVLPWMEGLDLEEEDSLGLPDPAKPGFPHPPGGREAVMDVAVIRFPRISNFTDFQPLGRAPGMALRYVETSAALGNPDLLILPGSKNVRRDLEWLARTGLDRAVLAAAARHIPVLGICGGYQMLGRAVRDPHGVEDEAGEIRGLSLLPVVTEMAREKDLGRVAARNLSLPFLPEGAPVTGYEIHMGRTLIAPGADTGAAPWTAAEAVTGDASVSMGRARAALELISRNGTPCRIPSGLAAPDRPVFGCYLHGLFEDPAVVDGLAAWLHARRGLPFPAPRHSSAPDSPALRPTHRPPEPLAGPADPLDRLADALEALGLPERLAPGLSLPDRAAR